MVGTHHADARQFEHGLRGGAHRHLPVIELAPFAAHGHDGEERQAEQRYQREHVDAVADAAGLHQERTALPAGPGARDQGHALLFRRQRNAAHGVGGEHALDQPGMSGVRHIGHLPHVVALQHGIDVVRPGGRLLFRRVGAGVHRRFRCWSCSPEFRWAGAAHQSAKPHMALRFPLARSRGALCTMRRFVLRRRGRGTRMVANETN